MHSHMTTAKSRDNDVLLRDNDAMSRDHDVLSRDNCCDAIPLLDEKKQEGNYTMLGCFDVMYML